MPDADGGPDIGAPPFSVEISPAAIVIPQGGSAEVQVTVHRDTNFDEAIDFGIDGLPEGVAAEPLTLSAGSTAGKLTLTAPASVGVPCPDAARVRGHIAEGSSSALLKVSVRGPAGSLDLSFDSNGMFESQIFATDVAEQVDGKLVFTGWSNPGIYVCRVGRDGEPDSSFGSSGGCAILNANDADSGGRQVAIFGDGIYVAGRTGAGAVVARLTTSGALDLSFGEAGFRTIFPGTTYSGLVLDMIVADQRLVISGDAGNAGYLACLTLDGDFDTTFAGGGRIVFGNNVALKVVRLPDSRLVVSNGGRLFGFTQTGGLDSTFGGNGSVALEGYYAGWGLAAMTNGDVVAGGRWGAQMERFSRSGALVSTYSALPIPADAPDEPDAFDIVSAPDDTIILAGMLDIGHVGMVRRLPNGEPDSNFGINGESAWFYAGCDGCVLDTEILLDGRYIVAGGYLVRYWN